MDERGREASTRVRLLAHQRNADLLAFVGDVEGALASVEEAVRCDLLDFAWMERATRGADPRVASPVAPPRFGARGQPIGARGHSRTIQVGVPGCDPVADVGGGEHRVEVADDVP